MCVLQWRTGAWHTGVLARTLRRRDASAPVMRRTGVLARTLRRRGRQRTGYVAYGRPRPYIAQAGTPAHRVVPAYGRPRPYI